MKSKKIITLILLALFVLTLPIALLASDTSSILFNKEKVTDLVVTKLVSDEALPRLIKEITLLETLHGKMDKTLDNRMLVNVLGGIHSDQWLELFAIVLPEDQRVGLVEDVTGGIFTWLENDQPYPDVVIPVGKILSNVESNLLEVSTWVFGAFRVPPCEPDQVARYQAGDYGEDPQALITCTPPAEMTEDVISATALVIGNTLAKQAPPAEIALADQLSSQMSAEEMLTQKAQAKTARIMLGLFWLLPVIFFVIAIALMVRSAKDLITWVQWPFFAAGALSVLLALRVGNLDPILRDNLLPIPEAIVPPPAVAVILRLADGLFSQVGAAMLWQTLPLLVIGAALLVYTYRENLKAVPASLGTFFRSFIPPTLEEKA